MVAQKDVVLYTCIVNKRDRPKIIETKDDFDYVLFSDENLHAPSWYVRPLCWSHDDPVRTARYHKHNPFDIFPDYQYAIWLDATHWPYQSLMPLLREHDISVMKHVQRSTIKDEAMACAAEQMDDPNLMAEQLKFYQANGFEDNLGLYSTSCLISRNTPDSIEFHKLWWSEICKWSRRDQLSFPYCLWKHPINLGIIPGYCRLAKNDYFRMISHYQKTISLC